MRNIDLLICVTFNHCLDKCNGFDQHQHVWCMPTVYFFPWLVSLRLYTDYLSYWWGLLGLLAAWKEKLQTILKVEKRNHQILFQVKKKGKELVLHFFARYPPLAVSQWNTIKLAILLCQKFYFFAPFMCILLCMHFTQKEDPLTKTLVHSVACGQKTPQGTVNRTAADISKDSKENICWKIRCCVNFVDCKCCTVGTWYC